MQAKRLLMHSPPHPQACSTLRILLLGGCFLVPACASFHPLPLTSLPPLAPDVDSLEDPGVRAQGGMLRVADVARLAVQNNPDLRATRAQLGVAQAQLLQAGLPPNPVVTGSILPLAAGLGDTTAWNAGMSYDIRSLLTLSLRRRSTRDVARQVNAQILWQEWQVAGQARLLAIDLIEGARTLRLLGRERALLAERGTRSQAALAAGNATLATIAPDIAAVQAARSRILDIERLQLTRRHQLAALLGLLTDAALPLTETPDLPPLDPDAMARALPRLADHRPDLVALRLGYFAQNERVRAAILSQFPNLTFGITGGSDNANVRNVGPQIALDLPIFDHNQGGIAIERATRQQLHDEYAARLATAHGQVAAMLSEIALLVTQRALVQADLPALARAAVSARTAFAAANIDDRSYVDLVDAATTKELELVIIEQSILEQQVALATLTGAGLPELHGPGLRGAESPAEPSIPAVPSQLPDNGTQS